MKATGIVRRIDDLGRVVIPKEIRRTMRIREGDPLEIYTDRNGEVIFKKYSPISELSAFAAQTAIALNNTIGKPVIISDKDTIVAVSGISKKDLLDRQLSENMDEIIKSNKVYKNEGNNHTVNFVDGYEKFSPNLCVPISYEGDSIGSICIATKDGKDSISPEEEKLCTLASQILANQMEV
ncbi:MAG: AbrB/MazE/SpoVT family DNA-binding domain-containing protein [Clostridia bacterium]|nr:AbrB/MazE/SpoVT family DNA-binding domain-containing protein [Clostridia bacterium]